MEGSDMFETESKARPDGEVSWVDTVPVARP